MIKIFYQSNTSIVYLVVLCFFFSFQSSNTLITSMQCNSNVAKVRSRCYWGRKNERIMSFIFIFFLLSIVPSNYCVLLSSFFQTFFFLLFLLHLFYRLNLKTTPCFLTYVHLNNISRRKEIWNFHHHQFVLTQRFISV